MKGSLVAAISFLSLLSCGFLSARDHSGEVVKMDGAFLEMVQKRDSVLIADQLRYGFHLKDVVPGTVFRFPDLSKGLRDSVEVLSPWRSDTVKVHGKKKAPSGYDIDAFVLVTSFEEGVYELPPLALLRLGAGNRVDTLVFDPMTLDVKTMPVDTATFVINDIKGQVKYPLSFSEVLPYALVLWGLALVAILVWILLSRKGKEGREVRQDPPHVVALRKLERYRGSKYWAPDKQKIMYSGITDTLKEYMAARYSFDAMEMTTGEIFSTLEEDSLPEGMYEEMKTLFQTADLVKFAKAYATDQENAAALPSAVRFITATYEEPLSADKEKGGGE